MVKIDIERINKTAPYRVVQSKPGFLTFQTDSKIRYIVIFADDDLLTCSSSHQMMLLNPDHKPSPRDSKLRDTVIAIITEFFESNQSTMLYICETSDGRQEMRSRLFSHWFKAFADEKQYIYRHAELLLDDVTNFLSIILRSDNPDAALVLEEWDSNIFALSEKPNIL